jgi:hypothetical protein
MAWSRARKAKFQATMARKKAAARAFSALTKKAEKQADTDA